SGVFGGHDVGGLTAGQALGHVARQDDGVKLRAQHPRTDVGVADALEWKLVLLEQPSRPSFVNVRGPRLVQGGQQGRKRSNARRRLAVDAVASQSDPTCDLLKRGRRVDVL